MSYTVRKTWRYGDDYRATEHTASTIAEALCEAGLEVPDWAMGVVVEQLADGEAYFGWPGFAFELVEPVTTPEPPARRFSSQTGLASFRNPSNVWR